VADAVHVRRARLRDVPALPPLLFLAAEDMYLRMAGSRERALRTIEADLRRGARDATWVAELDGELVAAMVAYPYRDEPDRVRAFLRALIPRTPPWRWPAIARLHWRGQRRGPRHPVDCIYVDALSTSPSARRRGAAAALLAEAERVAAAAGLRWLALETAATNHGALALYGSTGFTPSEHVAATGPVPRTVCLVKEVGA
jgi:GNAT superfamily N-acetyltransferase